jgi:glycerophosphoryl diester phosphodiesterase
VTNILLDPSARPIIAHRGASGRAPENTMRAFELALEEGADALELDVHATADGIPVVMHDPTLDRTTNATGVIAALPFERLREVDAGYRFTDDRGRTFPWRGQGVRIPTLAEVLTTFASVPTVVEIKSALASEAVERTVRELGAADRCLLMSFDARALDRFRAPSWLTGATSEEAARLLSSALFRRPHGEVRYRALSVPERWRGLPVPLGVLSSAARRLGRPVHVWVVNSPAHAVGLWRRGVAGVVTNYPREMREARV